MNPSRNARINRIFPFALIIKAGLLAGTLDILSACLYSYIKRGNYPADVLTYIGKVVFGENISNPILLAATGLLIHFLIAMCWTALFFYLFSRIKLMRQNSILTGFVYG
ncbi:MAG TPA: hypothetical protein VHL77_04365, partial [Ferruginibacter sp.]|nr:hypothetical protein [Ferruginibacter sp.]